MQDFAALAKKNTWSLERPYILVAPSTSHVDNKVRDII